MSEKVRKVILERGWDVDWKFGKPMSVLPFHREYLIDWDIDGRCRYWTAGYKDWVVTNLTRQSIDDYYGVVSAGMDKNNNLGPRPTTKHLDGKSAYSPCGYCDYSPVCAIGDRLTTTEFKDHATKLADEEWKTRKN